MNNKKQYHYYESLDGTIYRGIIVGFHMDTGEQLIALRRVSDGTVWFMSKAELNSVVLVNGIPTHKYQERFDIDEDNSLRTAPNPYAAQRFREQEYMDTPEKQRANSRDFERNMGRDYTERDFTNRDYNFNPRDNYDSRRNPHNNIIVRGNTRHPNRGR